MLRVPIPTLAPPPSVQQICAMSTETSISLPSRRSQRRKRVFESHDDDLLAAKSPASKKLFSSKVETLKTKPVIVKTEVETLKTKRAVVKAELEVVEKPRVSSQGDCLVKAEEVESGIGEEGWCSLGVGQAELCLDLTLPTGQSFRWRKTGPSQYTGVINTHLVSLRQISNNVEFLHHASSATASLSDVEKEIREYLNLDTSLVELYAKFTAADARFAAVAPFIAGARLLRQPPLECVFQFICSSNNHIQRITTMVDYLSSQGLFLGSVNGFRFHQFPTLDQLSPLSEAELRETGFGYRAKYVVGSVELLHQKEEGGEQWLLSLRGQPLDEVVTSLCTLPGIGPKVAACIALFSLDQHHAIPVDTHVWQIAVRYLLPELEGRKLTVKLHREVADAFVKRFGSYAGWAHTVLFIAELSSQQSLLPFHLRVPKKPSVKTPN